MNRTMRWVALFALVAVGFVGVGARALGQDSGTDRSGLRFVVVSHGQASDPFWSVVQNGVNQAAEDMGVEVEYQAPDTFDMVAMSQLIDAAVASSPDGIVVSIPDPDALGESIRAAVDAGIPVISMNSGSDVAAEFGLLNHVGQTEYEAGVGAGQRMGEAGVTNALCVNQEVGNAALDRALPRLHRRPRRDRRHRRSPRSRSQQPGRSTVPHRCRRQRGRVDQRRPRPGPDRQRLRPSRRCVRRTSSETVSLATFDLSPDVLEAIVAGEMLFAIDQQQYIQGYLPIVLLTLNVTNLNTVANPVIMTGPGFVTQENAERVIELSAAGTR